MYDEFRATVSGSSFSPHYGKDVNQLATNSTSSAQTIAAYTTSRTDIFSLVPAQSMAVLDVGCSNGALGSGLKAAAVDRRVVGLERDPDLARTAARYLDKIIMADLNHFDWHSELENESFDCIIFADVLEHLADPGAQLRFACSRLRPGGCVVISLPNIRHVSALLSIFGRGSFPRRTRGLFDATHLRWFTIADGRGLLAENGLHIEAESYALRLGDQGGGRINRILNRLPAFLQRGFVIREFLTYQFSLRARVNTLTNQNL